MSAPPPRQRPTVVTSGSNSPTSTDTPRSGTPASASPFPSRSPIPSRSPSRTASLTSPNGANSANTLHPPSTSSSRRNRAALRDYYGLKKPPDDSAASSSRGASPDPGRDDQSVDGGTSTVVDRELDAPGFNAEAYVEGLLESQGLESLLRTESGLVNEIKYLTSERAALVYDNYSKLIAATDTIQHMRSNMAPLAPATSTLAPAVAHIAGTAEQLAFKKTESPRTAKKGDTAPEEDGQEEDVAKRCRDRATVRWVLDAPRRIRDNGPEEAEWDTVRTLLEKWQGAGVPGAEKVKVACERAVEEGSEMKA